MTALLHSQLFQGEDPYDDGDVDDDDDDDGDDDDDDDDDVEDGDEPSQLFQGEPDFL